MASLNETFELNQMPVGNSDTYTPLPDGWYTVSITKAEMADTKAGTGQLLKLRLDVSGPTHQGRVIFNNLNIRNPNPTAEEIARKNLGDIMRALGLARLDDSDQLIGGQMSVKLATKDGNNEVKAYKASEGAVIPVAPAASTSTSTKAAPPWARK